MTSSDSEGNEAVETRYRLVRSVHRYRLPSIYTFWVWLIRKIVAASPRRVSMAVDRVHVVKLTELGERREKYRKFRNSARVKQSVLCS